MLKTQRLLFIFLVLSLVGCNIIPTNVPVLIETSALSKTPTSTETIFPTITSSPSPTLTLTPEPLTQEKISEAITNNDYKSLCGGYADSVIEYSPSHMWAMVYCYGRDYTYTKIFRLDGHQSWVVSTKDLEFPDENYRTNYLYLDKWSTDEEYVYLHLFMCCMDGGPGGIALHDLALYQLDLASGNLLTILQPNDALYDLNISPDTRFVSYSTQRLQKEVFVRDLITNIVISQELDREYSTIGSFVWAPDNSRVYFAGETKEWSIESGGFSLFFWDVKSNSIEMILDNDDRLLVPVKWIDSNILLVWSPKPVNNNQYWHFNIKTKELTPTQDS